jgi:ferredoxin|tara:strand:+ start:223 stop:546 length:324 start_codon:yes stop_codon:yes gene_type:complete
MPVTGSDPETFSARRIANRMTYIIVSPCVDVRDGACVDVCPVDCIYSNPEDNMLYINPEECIDCAACEPVCPVTAIFPEDQVPENEQSFIALNYDYDYDSSEPGDNK